MYRRQTMKFFILIYSLLSCVVYGFAGDFIVGENQAMELYDPGQVAEGPHGEIYVYDRKDIHIKVYAPNGKYLRYIGKQGEGPGEIKRMGSFGFTRQSGLFFVEFFGGHRWITIMDLDGKLLQTIKIDIGNRIYGVSRAHCTGDGGFICTFSFEFKAEKRGDYFLLRAPMKLIKIDARGKFVSEITAADDIQRMSYIGDGADAPVPFSPPFEWGVLPDNTIIFSNGCDKNLKVFNDRGVLVKVIKTSLPDARDVTGADLAKWRKEYKNLLSHTAGDKLWYDRFGDVVEKYKKPIHRKIPHLRGLSITPQGNILVSVNNYRDDEKTSYWLLNKTGETLARISATASSLKITKSYILYSTEVDDEPMIHCFARDKAEDEKTSLLRFGKNLESK